MASGDSIWSIAPWIPILQSSQVMTVSSGAAQMGPHIHSAVGSQYPGQRRAAIMLQNSGRDSSQLAGSSTLGQSPPTRIACCAAMLSSEESLAAMVETTAVQSLQLSAAARARRAEDKMKTF